IGASRSAAAAKAQTGAWLAHTYVHSATPRRWRDRAYGRALAAGERVIACSDYVAARMLDRHALPTERVIVIPRRIDTAWFDPRAVDAGRLTAIRRAWKIRRGDWVLLAPGRLDPTKGQLDLV